MASGEDFLRYVGGAVRKAANDHVSERFTDGFNEAANICVTMLSEKIDELMDRMKTGELSRPDQVLLSSLTVLKSETEQKLFRYWETLAADN